MAWCLLHRNVSLAVIIRQRLGNSGPAQRPLQHVRTVLALAMVEMGRARQANFVEERRNVLITGTRGCNPVVPGLALHHRANFYADRALISEITKQPEVPEVIRVPTAGEKELEVVGSADRVFDADE